MTEIFSPRVESSSPAEAIGPAELEEVLRRARAPIIREGFAEPWAEDPATFDPAQAGWEQAGQNLLGQIDRMRSSGLVQLTPEGLTPKQAAEKAGEAAKLAEANTRAAELAEQLRRMRKAGPPPFAPASLTEGPVLGGSTVEEAEEVAAEPEEEEIEEQVKGGLSKFLGSVPWKRIALEGATIIPPMVFGGVLGYFDPETARNVSLVTGTAGVGMAFTSMAAAMAERILPAHARAGLLGKALVAAKVGGLYAGNVLLSTAIGSHMGAGIRQGIEALQAAQQAGAGGELPGGGGLPPRSDWVEEARAQGWPSAEQRFQAGGGAEELRAQGWQPLGGQPPPAEQPPVEAVTPHLPQVPVDSGEAELQAALEVATKVVEVQPGDTLTDLVSRAGGDAYGADFTNTVLQSADVLTGPQNPNRDMASALIDFIKAHPDGVNWRDAINGVGDLAKEMVGGVPLKDAIAQATRMIYPGQEMKIVVGAAMP